jgi:hypothetical protein
MGDSNDLSTRVVNSAGATILNARSIHDLKGSMTLPTEKQTPTISPENARILVYGEPGSGKTSLGAGLDPEHTLILATEPGTGGLEAYVQEVRTWEEFLNVGAELAKGKHRFKQIVVDTADALQTMCQDHAIATLNKTEGTTFTYPGDFAYGKGWDAVSKEWRRLSRFAQLGYGVMFTSHSKAEEIERPVGKVTRYSPTLSGASLKWLAGFCEFVFYLEVVNIGGKDVRVLRSNKSPLHVAKGRVQRPMPDPLVIEAANPLDSGRILREAMAEATRVEKPEPVAA